MITFVQLLMDKIFIRLSHMMVKDFDEATNKVVSDIDIELVIRPYVFNVLFHIMNIKLAYNMLVGRSWIHSTGAIPSSSIKKLST